MPSKNTTNRSPLQRLSRRDLEVLRWVCEQSAARIDHITALIGLSSSVARQTVTRLCRAGLLTRERYIVDEPAWLLPTRRGLEASGVVGRLWTPAVGEVTHLAAINKVRLHIQRLEPEAEWISERQLHWEHAEGPGRPKRRPDGVVIYQKVTAAIEVELHYKGRRHTAAVLDQHARSYDVTVYFCDRLVHRYLTRLSESGRWPQLEVRPLPGSQWAERGASEARRCPCSGGRGSGGFEDSPREGLGLREGLRLLEVGLASPEAEDEDEKDQEGPKGEECEEKGHGADHSTDF